MYFPLKQLISIKQCFENFLHKYDDLAAPSVSQLLKAEESPTELSAHEEMMLRKYCIAQKRCYLRMEGIKHRYQSIIIHYDHRQIVLDELFPKIASHVLDGMRATLELHDDSSYACVSFNIVFKRSLSDTHFTIAKIVTAKSRQDRRSSARLIFKEHYAPPVKLMIPMMTVLQGKVSNLSTGGALITSEDMSLARLQIGHNYSALDAECQITFANDVKFDCTARLYLIDLQRYPKLTAKFRLSFGNLSEENEAFLQTLITLGKPPKPNTFFDTDYAIMQA